VTVREFQNSEEQDAVAAELLMSRLLPANRRSYSRTSCRYCRNHRTESNYWCLRNQSTLADSLESHAVPRILSRPFPRVWAPSLARAFQPCLQCNDVQISLALPLSGAGNFLTSSCNCSQLAAFCSNSPQLATALHNMRILEARKATGVLGREKLDNSNVRNDEVNQDGEITSNARSTGQDAFDMRKLGVRQETKVSSSLQ